MKIKSITDVVTNSSSEVYVIKTGMTEKEFRKILLEITKDCIGCSGMGGIMDIHKSEPRRRRPRLGVASGRLSWSPH